MITLATVLSGISLLMGVLMIIQQPKFPQGFYLLFPKLPAGALSPVWAIMGIAGAVIGGICQAFWAIPMGIVGAGMMIWYIWQCAQDHDDFQEAFGADWANQIPPQQAKRMVQKRWSWFLKMKASPEPVVERDIPYWTVPDTDRQLLCDLWRPAEGNVSGLALIYIHGGAWFIWDKDTYTRPFFNHLVAQGHTVMDVAYRLCPEVDIYGMIGDVKRAIAWMKANASRYGVISDKIVIGGGSAGGHLALLAGYAPQHPELTPDDIKGADLSVRGVISYYGLTDLLAEYQHFGLEQMVDRPPVPIGPDTTLDRRDLFRMDILLGGHPTEALSAYQLASPATHIHSGSPPTLLIQGTQDCFVPVDTTRALHKKLVESGVPAINRIFPWTNHAFDLFMPSISPAAQSALYDVDRFLAFMLGKDES